MRVEKTDGNWPEVLQYVKLKREKEFIKAVPKQHTEAYSGVRSLRVRPINQSCPSTEGESVAGGRVTHVLIHFTSLTLTVSEFNFT